MEVLDNIYINRCQLVGFVKYVLSQIYNHCIQNCTFWCGNFCFLKKIFSKSSYIYVFYRETSDFRNPEMSGRRKLCDSSINNIFNVPSIGLQYKLSFKWTDFGLKCLVTKTSKGQSLKFKDSVWNTPDYDTRPEL